MNDLIRPAMYDAWHGIVPVAAVDAVAPVAPADVVGPVCESGDTFARDRMLPALAPGARVAILDAGAYGSVMSSALQCAPGGGRGDGGRQRVVGDSRARQPHRLVAWRTRATLAQMSAPGGDLDRLLRRLAGRRALARLAILFERIWPALWPALGVAGLFVCVALLDLPRLLPPWLHIGAARRRRHCWSSDCWYAACRASRRRMTRRPTAASSWPPIFLTGRLSVLTDRPSRAARGPDTASVALWQAHVARAVNSVRRLRIGVPRPGLARRDPRALRAALVVALVAAFAIAGDDAPSRLAQAMEPTLPRETAAAGDRATGLDHTARLHGAGADLPQAGQRERVGARRRPSDGQRHRWQRHPAPDARRAVRTVPRPRQGKLPGRPRPEGGRAVSRYGAMVASWQPGTWRSSLTSRRRRIGPTVQAARPAVSRRGYRGTRRTTTAWSRCRLRCGCATGAMHRPWW